MQLVAVPPEMRRSTLVLPSGQVLFPFEDSPHITNDGVLLHGRSALQRAIVYRILQQSECLSPNGWVVARGQARPPEPGEVVASFPFSQLYALPAVPVAPPRPTPPIPPWLLPQSRPTPIHKQTTRTYWGGPLWRGRFLLGFLDPKLVSRKITFFDPLKEQKVWKTCEG